MQCRFKNIQARYFVGRVGTTIEGSILSYAYIFFKNLQETFFKPFCLKTIKLVQKHARQCKFNFVQIMVPICMAKSGPHWEFYVGTNSEQVLSKFPSQNLFGQKANTCVEAFSDEVQTYVCSNQNLGGSKIFLIQLILFLHTKRHLYISIHLSTHPPIYPSFISLSLQFYWDFLINRIM